MDKFQLLDIYHLCHELIIEGYFKSEIECFTVYTSELCLFPPWIFLRKAAAPGLREQTILRPPACP